MDFGWTTFDHLQIETPRQAGRSFRRCGAGIGCPMDADTFIRRWSASSRNETAGSKPHFLDLCSLLDLPPPTEDPDGSIYAFEKAVAKANGRKGWADV